VAKVQSSSRGKIVATDAIGLNNCQDTMSPGVKANDIPRGNMQNC